MGLRANIRHHIRYIPRPRTNLAAVLTILKSLAFWTGANDTRWKLRLKHHKYRNLTIMPYTARIDRSLLTRIMFIEKFETIAEGYTDVKHQKKSIFQRVYRYFHRKNDFCRNGIPGRRQVLRIIPNAYKNPLRGRRYNVLRLSIWAARKSGLWRFWGQKTEKQPINSYNNCKWPYWNVRCFFVSPMKNKWRWISKRLLYLTSREEVNC